MKQPNLFALGAVIVGIVAAIYVSIPPLGWLLFGLICLTVAGWRFNRYHQAPGWLVLGALIAVAAFILAYWRGAYDERVEYNRGFAGRQVMVEGRVVSRPEPTQRGCRLELELFGYRGVPRGKVTVYYTRNLPESWLGSSIRVTGSFKTLPAKREQWPDFYEIHQLTGVINAQKRPIGIDSRNCFWTFSRLANHLRRQMGQVGQNSLSPLHWQVLQGMLFGTDLSEEGTSGAVLEDFRRTGTIHLLSVSGLHVGFVVAGLTWLLGWWGVNRAGRIPVLLGGVGFYILMTGMEAPVLRAGLMLVLYVIAAELKSQDDPINRLGLAAVILLLLNPYQLFEIGFQLSFAATAGVVGLYPRLKEYFPVNVLILRPIWLTLLISVAAQLLVLPLLANYFNQISWIAPLANLLLAIPALLMVVGGLAGELVGLVFPGLGHLVLSGVNWVIAFSLQLIHLCAQPNWAVSWSPGWPWPWMAAYYLGLGLMLQMIRPNLITGRRECHWGLLALVSLGTLNLIVWAGYYLKCQPPYLEVAFINVGQGDAIFMRTPDGYTVLVDGGDEGRGRGKVLPFLREQGIGRLDQVFGTHGDRDHLGGLDEVLQRIPAGRLCVPAEQDPVTRKFESKIHALRLRRNLVANGKQLRWGKYVQAWVFKIPGAQDDNDASTVLLVEYGKYRLLLTGDLGVEGESYLTEHYPHLLKSAVLKAGHHGSNYASTWSLLSQVKPQVTVLSVGAGNRYGHPGKATLNRLHSIGTAVYRTDLQGTIRIRIYADRILVIPDKGTQDEAG